MEFFQRLTTVPPKKLTLSPNLNKTRIKYNSYVHVKLINLILLFYNSQPNYIKNHCNIFNKCSLGTFRSVIKSVTELCKLFWSQISLAKNISSIVNTFGCKTLAFSYYFLFLSFSPCLFSFVLSHSIQVTFCSKHFFLKNTSCY